MVARAKIAMRGDLGRGGEERRHRRRRALVDVRRPHVERHRRDLEAEAGEQEHQAEDQADAALPRRLGDAGKRHVAGEAVDQRAAVEQHARRQRAEHEILQAGLGRAHGIAVRGRDHVERETHQFEPEIERDQVAGRDQHAHADGREQDQHGVFELLLPLGREIVERHDDGEGRADVGQDLQEAREVVDHEAAAEDPCRSGCRRRSNGRGDQQHDRAEIDDLRAALAVGAEHQQRHGADRQHDFRQSLGQRANGDGVHRRGLTSPARRISPRRAHAGSCRAAPSPRRPTCRAPASDRSRAAGSG